MKNLVLALVVLALTACDQRSSPPSPKVDTAEIQKQRDEQARREAEERQAKENELKVKCVDRVDAMIRTSRTSIKNGRAQDAVDELRSCGAHLQKKEAVALLETAKQALVTQGIKEEKEAERAEKARKKKEGVRLGMSQQEAIDSMWGKPNKVNRTVNRYGVREQWVYDNGYLYFEDGVLTSVQN